MAHKGDRYSQQAVPRDVMRQLIDLRIAGTSYRDIAKLMNERGAFTRLGHPWNHEAVSSTVSQWVRLVFEGDTEYDMMVPLSEHNDAVDALGDELDSLARKYRAACVERDATRREMARVMLEHERGRAGRV